MATITPAPTPGEAEFSSIYSEGDLILVNPIQSTVIFLSVIIFSTLLEYVIEKIQEAKNKYVRTIVFAAKDEITNISLVGMILLFVAFSFPLSSSWRTVIQWVDMCIVYMAAGYVIMISSILALLKVRTNKWRMFEWARIEAVSHHSAHEDLFKTARDYFTLLVKLNDPEQAEKLQDTSLVTFSTYMAHYERNHLGEITDFSYKTWFGLGLIIIVNGSRAITAASVITGETDDDKRLQSILQVVTYVLIIGYGNLIVYGVCHAMFERRFRRYIVGAIVAANQADDLDRETTPQECFFFKSMSATLEVFKISMLSIMWYAAVQIMAYSYVAYRDMGFYSIILYVLAALPVFFFVLRFPWTLNLVFMCDALAENFDYPLVERLLNNEQDDDSEASSSDDDDGSGDEDDFDDDGTQKKKKKRNTEEDAELEEVQDEFDSHEITLHSTTPAHSRPVGEPTKVESAFMPTRYAKREARPVFTGL